MIVANLHVNTVAGRDVNLHFWDDQLSHAICIDTYHKLETTSNNPLHKQGEQAKNSWSFGIFFSASSHGLCHGVSIGQHLDHAHMCKISNCVRILLPRTSC